MMNFLRALLYPGMVYIFTLAMFLEWLDRKLVAKFQNRVGPMYAGPLGLLQPLADFLKLLSKESIIPAGSDRILFNICPISAFVVITLAVSFVPMVSVRGLLSTEGDLIVVLALLTIYLLLVYTSGASPPSRYSQIGAARAALMLLGFDLPLMMSSISVAVTAGSFKLSDIIAQGRYYIVGLHFIGFLIFLVAAQAELDRLPFDIPEAESEIVSGWLVEYSSWRLALLRLAKNIEFLLLTGLAVNLYLGGPLGPSLPSLEPFLQPLYFILKLVLVTFLLSLIRASFARLRIDQFVTLGWHYLLPLSLIYLVMTVVLVN